MSLWKLWVSLLWLTCNTDQLFEPRHVVNPFPFPHPFPLTFDSVFSGLFMEQGFIGREPHGGRSMHLITIGPYDFRNHRIMDRIVESANINIMDWISVSVFFFFFLRNRNIFVLGEHSWEFVTVCHLRSSHAPPRTIQACPRGHTRSWQPSKIAKLITYPNVHDRLLCAR